MIPIAAPRPARVLRLAVLVLALAAWSAGCASSPSPESPPPPPQGSSIPAPDPETGFTRIVAGADDSVGAMTGSARALYAYRFRQIEPGSDRFTFQDRELSFYFRPTPEALHMQVENRQNRPVWIEWERSKFLDPRGNSQRVGHATTRWSDRFGTQPPTEIVGLQRYSDYMFPIDDLVDPAGDSRQLRRTLFAEDQTAIQNVDRVFGVDLVFRIEDRLVTYPFRFRVASVLPR